MGLLAVVMAVVGGLIGVVMDSLEKLTATSGVEDWSQLIGVTMCGLRRKKWWQAWIVVGSVVAVGGEIGGYFGAGSMKDIGWVETKDWGEKRLFYENIK